MLAVRSHKHLSQLAELELSRDEDSVTSLAYLRRDGHAAGIALAGVNSSIKAQEANQNEHLRSYKIEYPKLTETQGNETPASGREEKSISRAEVGIEPISRRSLFRPSTEQRKETYQRLLRLSPASSTDNQSRLAAIATGLAPEGEIVLFQAYSGTARDQLLGRIALGKGQEAADIDVFAHDDGEYTVAFCTNVEVSVCKVQENVQLSKEPPPLEFRRIFVSTGVEASSSSNPRSKPRALRFLTSGLLLVLSNKAGRSGTELLVFRYGEGLAEIISRKRLHVSMKAGIGLEVANLRDSRDQMQRCVVAVAGQDISIEILVVEYDRSGKTCNFNHYATLRDVHPLQLTKICFSNLRPPTDKMTTSHLRLASVSMGNTAVMHTLPLEIVEASGRRRYALPQPSQTPGMLTPLIVLALAIIIGIAASYYPIIFHNAARHELDHGFASKIQDQTIEPLLPEAAKPRLQSRLSQATQDGNKGEEKPLLFKQTSDEINAEIHEDMESAQQAGRKWEDLKHHEQEEWKRRLIKAGEWAVEEGESILKGVFFGEIAGQVAHAVAG